MNALLDTFLNADVIDQVWRYLANGLLVTVGLSLLIIPLGLAGGLSLAWLRTFEHRGLNWALQAYTDVFRALPPLVLLVVVYYGIPFTGWEISRIGAVAIAFLLHAASYFGEILRAGVESVPRGQWEAASATGMGRGRTFVHVVLPQAVRNVLPDLIGNMVEAVKLTSIASVIALPELLHNARQAQSITMSPTPVIVAGLVYLAILWPLIRLLARLEHSRGELP